MTKRWTAHLNALALALAILAAVGGAAPAFGAQHGPAGEPPGLTSLLERATSWLVSLWAAGDGEEGWGMDPNGVAGQQAPGDEGIIIDPDGAEGDEGWIIDPNGSEGDAGWIIDPDG